MNREQSALEKIPGKKTTEEGSDINAVIRKRRTYLTCGVGDMALLPNLMSSIPMKKKIPKIFEQCLQRVSVSPWDHNQDKISISLDYTTVHHMVEVKVPKPYFSWECRVTHCAYPVSERKVSEPHETPWLQAYPSMDPNASNRSSVSDRIRCVGQSVAIRGDCQNHT